ncbi:MAG TPA: hypothetical protein VFV69_04965, partial [Steroidobacteraceae bacterium]|nr:hypothetical protein [Steroidobacteraceae bacterium]
PLKRRRVVVADRGLVLDDGDDFLHGRQFSATARVQEAAPRLITICPGPAACRTGLIRTASLQ